MKDNPKKPRDSKKYSEFRAKDKGGRAGLVGKNPAGQYSMGIGPRVGGSVKSTGMASGVSSKKLLKKSAKNVRKSAASASAKRSARKLY